jgi:hypothetical protein
MIGSKISGNGWSVTRFLSNRRIILFKIIVIILFASTFLYLKSSDVPNDNSQVKEKLSDSYQNPFQQNLKLDDGITEEAAKFIKELGLMNPGEGGSGVPKPQYMSEDIQRRIKEGFDTHHFNGK